MDYLEQALKKLNLSDNAVQMYLRSFQLGRTTIGALAKHLGMDRSSAYLASTQLIEKGLLLEDLIDGKRHVWASSPDTIETLLRKQAESFSDTAQNINAHLGELFIQYQTINRPVSLQSFSGRTSLRRITQDILSSDITQVRIITNQNAERNVFSAKEHDDFIVTRVRKGIKALVLAADTKGADLLQRYDDRELRETKVIRDLQPFKNETYIYGDKVAVLGFTDIIFGFIVHDKEFAQLQTLLFDHLFST